MTPENAKWIQDTEQAATQGSHIYPLMAAAEAALESAHAGVFGASVLARDAKNLFGMKQHQHPEYGTLSLPTKEFLDGEWKVVGAAWVSYPDFHACFLDRMHTLGRLASKYPHYAAALAAQDEFEYVKQVSQSWSSDPERAQKVTAIYDEYAEWWAANPPAAATSEPVAPEAPPAAPAPEAPVMGVDEATQV